MKMYLLDFFFEKRVKHTNSRVAQFHKPDLEN